MTQRYDVLVVPEDLNRKIAPAGAAAWLRSFAVSRAALPYEEAIAEEWVEVYCKPGPSAHEPFMKGGYESDVAVFDEVAVRFGTKGVPMPYGVKDQTIYFFVEFRGCLFKEPMGKFKNRFKDVLLARPAVYWREAEPAPPHREVGEDEQPVERKKKEVASGVAGTTTEEW